MITKVTTIVNSPGAGLKVRVWNYESGPQRRAFGGLAARTVREGGTVVSIGEDYRDPAFREKLRAAIKADLESMGVAMAAQMHLEGMTTFAQRILLTGGTLREAVQITHEQLET